MAGGPAWQAPGCGQVPHGTSRPATPVLTSEEPHLRPAGADLPDRAPPPPGPGDARGTSGAPDTSPGPAAALPAPAPRRRCRTGSVCHSPRSWVPRVPQPTYLGTPCATERGRRRRAAGGGGARGDGAAPHAVTGESPRGGCGSWGHGGATWTRRAPAALTPHSEGDAPLPLCRSEGVRRLRFRRFGC
jgi:hypothetical protein